MKKIYILIAAVFFLAGCGEPAGPIGTGTPTNISPVEIAGTMMQQNLAAEATKQAVSVQMSATAQIIGVTSTSYAVATQAAITQQARMDAQATSDQIRRDAQATQARIDADATQAQQRMDMEATQVQARLDVQATQQMSATQTAFPMTAAAIPTANALTMIANQQDITLKNDQLELSRLAVEQQRQKNTPEWLVPFLIAVLFAIVGAIFVIRYSRVREIKNDSGDLEMLIMDGKRGIRPQLLTGPVLDMGEDTITVPLLASSVEEQAKVTERAQAIDAIKNMPAQTTPQASNTFNKYFGAQRTDMFEVIDGEELPPAGLLDGETLKSLNKDWKEAQDDE